MKILSVMLSMFISVCPAGTISNYDFDRTLKNVKDILKQKNIPIFTEFDHSKNAKDANLELAPTKVIVFGNPKVGTLLMQENNAIAIELPLKILITQDKDNVVVDSTDIENLAKTYNIKNNKLIENIKKLLSEIITYSTK